MPLLGFLQGVGQDGLWGGIKDYAGNNTQLGQTINGAGNVYQGFNSQPQSQLIGNPIQNQNAVSSTPATPSKDDIIQKVIMKNNAQASEDMPSISAPDMSQSTRPKGLVSRLAGSLTGGLL